MAKAPALKEEPTPPIAASASQAPAFMAKKVAEDAGKGVSTAADDNIIPLIYILQSNSPQTKPRDPEYIPGAADGDIWLRSSGLPAISGDEGIIVQPCYFFRTFIEWRLPRGNGLAAVHDSMPPTAVEKPSPENPNKMIMMLPNGNQIVDVRNHIVRVFLPDGKRLPYSIPFSSTGHTVSRTWMNFLNTKQIDGQKAPSWACLYRLKTKSKTNASGTWNIFDVSDAGWIQSQEDYDAGAALYEAFASGEKRAAHDDLADAQPDPSQAAM